MSYIDNESSTLPILLDGKVLNRGQGQEGDNLEFMKECSEKQNEYELSIMRKRAEDWIIFRGQKITDEDLLILAESERPRPQPDIIFKADEILLRIDWERTILKQNEKLLKMKNEAMKNKKCHAGHDLGAREFTLTYSPKWMTDTEARDVMRKAIDKLVKYYTDEIIELRAVGEVGTNGLSHVHCFYKLQGGIKITDKNFKRAYKFWDTKVKQGYSGHQGGHHANVKHESDFRGYIEKDIEEAWLDIHVKGGV